MEARDAFERDGIVSVAGVVAGADVAAMRAHVWEVLATRGLSRDPSTWVPGGPLGLVELSGALRPGVGSDELLWEIGRADVFAPLATALVRAVDGVFGAGVWTPVDGQRGGLAAPNFPIAAAWNVPHAAWHVDEPTAAAHAHPWGLLGFAFLDDVDPGGGATVAIAGSPRRLGLLAAELTTPTGMVTTDPALAALAAEPWFAALFRPGDADERRRRFLEAPYRSRDLPLRVVELTGRAGDLVLIDPRCLHTISANVSARARLTMRLTCSRAG